MGGKYLDLNWGRLWFYESSGRGPAVLLLHANSLSALSFQRQLESPLGKRYRLVALDFPGHGCSAPSVRPDETYCLPGYARVVAEAISALSLPAPILVGNSLGGFVALEAMANGVTSQGLMLVDTHPLGKPPKFEDAFLPHPAMSIALNETWSEDELECVLGANFSSGVHTYPNTFREDLRRTDGRARLNLFASIVAGRYTDQIEALRALDAPIAAVMGENDQTVNRAYFTRLGIPTLWRGGVETIPAAGHVPQWEQPVVFNELLEAFILNCLA